MHDHALELARVTKSFGPTQVLAGVDLRVGNGEFIVIVGPSGCGKSTLLRIIAGLEAHTTGHVRIGGIDVDHAPPSQRGIAMVFQSYALYPHLDVEDNMTLALRRENTPKAEIGRRVAMASRMLQLEPLLARRPSQLSGGQRQRVAIGRAIVRSPRLFLFDEPLSNLDAALRVNTRIELARLHRELGAAMVYVTHDQVEAMTLADRIVVMHEGRVQQVGSPSELYDAPANLFVAGFIGSPKMNFITGEEAWRTGAHTLGVRPEHLRVDDENARWRGHVRHVEFLGADCTVFVETPSSGELVVRVPGHRRPALGDPVGLCPHDGRLLRFDAEGRRVRAEAVA